jgi:hypothetical protein
LTSEWFCSRDSALAKKGRTYERSQYFLRFSDRAVHGPALSVEAQAETTTRRGGIAKNVPVMWADHISTEGKLYGVWQALYGGGAFDFKEMSRRLAHYLPKILG